MTKSSIKTFDTTIVENDSIVRRFVFRPTQRPNRPLRRAFTIVELIGTCVLLSILFSMTVPMVLVIARERRSTEQRQFALQHVTNLLEHAASHPWSDLPLGELSLPETSSDLQTVLPGLERTLVVTQVNGEQGSRQIVGSIRWQGSTGQLVSPLKISTWVFETKEVP